MNRINTKFLIFNQFKITFIMLIFKIYSKSFINLSVITLPRFINFFYINFRNIYSINIKLIYTFPITKPIFKSFSSYLNILFFSQIGYFAIWCKQITVIVSRCLCKNLIFLSPIIKVIISRSMDYIN